MSSCGGTCGCGPSCNCDSGCKRNPGLGLSETTTTAQTVIAGVAPVKTNPSEMPETSTEGGHGCKCGSNCTCDPCNC
ncbi:metallothionein-like protein 1 [Rhodamnia argentea]|uniref:Metallothionein-like protein n=1 Tax=Rhodamnia argentea TaxID=178133 RepID=A0A8B8PS47_9MYRT|nr:metallothionein-like protein 1 [Rhodamnia argentea]